MSEPEDQPVASDEPGKPGRYERSANGLIASMIVTVLVVIVFVGLRTLIYGQAPDVAPEDVDYDSSVAEVQLNGDTVVYPAALPPDWVTTNFTIDRDRGTAYGFSFLTEENRFVGVRQEASTPQALLERLIDEDPIDEERTYQSASSVAATWKIYSDDGGDLAYVAVLTDGGNDGADDEIVVVYGSAGRAAIEATVESLTTAPIPR